MTNNALSPNIVIQSINLSHTEFKNNNYTPKKNTEINLNFRIDRKFSDDKKSLDVLFGVYIQAHNDPDDSGSLTLLVEMTGKFLSNTESIISLEEFSKINALAIIMPYIRETVTYLTAKSGMTPIILPPINIHDIVSQENSSNKEIKTEKS